MFDALAGGNLLTGIANSFINGFLGSQQLSDNRNAQKQNIEMQRETNEMNRQQHAEDIKTAYDLQQRSMDFNSAEARLAREWQFSKERIQQIRDAGINPYAVLAGASPSTAASSSPAAVPAGAPAVAPQRHDDFSGYGLMSNAAAGLSRMFNDFVQNSKTEQETKILAIEALTKLDENIARIDNIRAETAAKKKSTEHLDEQLYQLKSMRDDLIRQVGLQNSVMEEQAGHIKQQTETEKWQTKVAELSYNYNVWFNDFAKQKGVKEIQKLGAEISAAYASAILSNTQAKEMKMLGVLNRWNLRLDINEKKQLHKYVVDSARLEAESKKWKSYQDMVNTFNPFTYVDPLSVTAIGGAAALFKGKLFPKKVPFEITNPENVR